MLFKTSDFRFFGRYKDFNLDILKIIPLQNGLKRGQVNYRFKFPICYKIGLPETTGPFTNPEQYGYNDYEGVCQYNTRLNITIYAWFKVN